MSCWIDLHAHLDDQAFQDDLEQVIEAAENAGIGVIVSAGTSLLSSRKTLEISRRYPPVYAAVGIHPQEITEEPVDLAELEKLLTCPGVVAVGEVGLDYYWDKRYVREQHELFLAQIDLADHYGLPLIVHSRGAETEVLKTLQDRKPHVPVVWHCFSGDKELLTKICSRGFYLSVNGVMTYPKANTLRETLAVAPLERIFLETDAPYLAPQEKRGRRNEPAFLLFTASFLARLRGIELWALQRHLMENFQAVFGKWIGDEMDGRALRKTERGYTI